MKLERMIRYREKMDFIISSMESVPGEPKGDLEICGVFYKLHNVAARGLLSFTGGNAPIYLH